MKKTTFRYGIISLLVLCVLGLINYLGIKNIPNYNGAIGGYISIFLSLVFVYIGIKQFRDKINGGFVSYKQAFLLGILIVIFPALLNGLYSVIYAKFIDPGFMDKYYEQTVQSMKTSLPPEEFEIKLKSLQSEREIFGNAYLQFFMMFFTVFVIGTVVTAVSSLVLCKKPKTQTVNQD